MNFRTGFKVFHFLWSLMLVLFCGVSLSFVLKPGDDNVRGNGRQAASRRSRRISLSPNLSSMLRMEGRMGEGSGEASRKSSGKRGGRDSASSKKRGLDKRSTFRERDPDEQALDFRLQDSVVLPPDLQPGKAKGQAEKTAENKDQRTSTDLDIVSTSLIAGDRNSEGRGQEGMGREGEIEEAAILSRSSSSSASLEPLSGPQPASSESNSSAAAVAAGGGFGKGILDLDGFFLECVRIARSEVVLPSWLQKAPLERNVMSTIAPLTIRAGYLILFANEFMARNWSFCAAFLALLGASRSARAPDWATAIGAILLSAVFQPLFSTYAGFEVLVPALLLAVPFIVTFSRLIGDDDAALDESEFPFLALFGGGGSDEQTKRLRQEVKKLLPVSEKSSMQQLRQFIRANNLDVKTGGFGRTKAVVFRDVLQVYVKSAREEEEKKAKEIMEARKRRELRRQSELQRLRDASPAVAVPLSQSGFTEGGRGRDLDWMDSRSVTESQTEKDMDSTTESGRNKWTSPAAYAEEFREWDEKLLERAPGSKSSRKGRNGEGAEAIRADGDLQTGREGGSQESKAGAAENDGSQGGSDGESPAEVIDRRDKD
uniref:Uncharacterized protein n=1 Tax=Chromera velia CCMP2878 TaxID=1169474 RepID=A0A0G4GPD2_9ALVE|mmetsp:Transcript_33090/g.65655  ORF Transcript_33090/g.65655 Transcript_33090/m.65655 type:complete len:600 (+) Transcript_33090:425-2224(+)|eukprot:Cvel_5015.t1-p1 / transcript=Cvel_5015.t1 / gene=Cvel_5015 / organism=Chromera_velia_CCMP2878 / gene_product=hypothetical protein / transcript_product=hypothetical protein / location=Cvel_scaffold227:104896-112154(-) / protein_length=599 / sequence_SO=supercontig / SO=protein_coding / is_pseudo=false